MNTSILLGFGTNILTADFWKILFCCHSDGFANTNGLAGELEQGYSGLSATCWLLLFMNYFSFSLIFAPDIICKSNELPSRSLQTEQVWQLYTAYVDKKELNMKTNWNILSINTDFASYWLEELVMVQSYNLKPGTEKTYFWRRVCRKILHKIKEVLHSYMPRN